MVNARANVLDARSGLYGAYSGVLPRASASLTRSGSWLDNRSGSEVFGGLVTPAVTLDEEDYTTTPGVSATWSVFNLSALSGLRSARSGMKAATLQQSATRNDVALNTRTQFYTVVRAIHLARVNSEALQLARSDERRVRALFEVGSVSRSDVLTAQVQTAQSELDSLTAVNQISIQRINLAELIGVDEPSLGDIDTVLATAPRSYDEGQILEEAGRNRPDVLAAEAAYRSAQSGVTSARFLRFPYLTLSGSTAFNPSSTAKTSGSDSTGATVTQVSRTEIDRSTRAAVAVNWDFFDGLSTDSRVAAARAQLLRAQETRNALRRNLSAEVRRTLLAYREAVEGVNVAQRAVDAASERLKLTQQKYNVGSSTILDLVDAQVQLQRAENQLVDARAAVRVAEAAVDRVRGTPQ
jgi:outer membrane protein TolC